MATKKKLKITLLCVLTALIIIFVSCAVYLGDYYRADTALMANYTFDEVTVTTLYDGVTLYSVNDAEAGFIFYPGGKVEAKAYDILMKECAARGIACVLVEMPFNLAVFNMNAASEVTSRMPSIERWYIGGHSLGGSMAASHVSKNPDKYEGLILLASYSTADLSQSGLEVLSVYGGQDRVLNAEKYEKYKTNLPTDFTEYVIDGGCHAYFGMYGKQKGDGEATIIPFEQIKLTADYVEYIILG